MIINTIRTWIPSIFLISVMALPSMLWGTDVTLVLHEISNGDFDGLDVGWFDDVDLGDLDGDGDMDVLSASPNDNKIAWYENDGSENFTPHNISTSAGGARDVYAVDEILATIPEELSLDGNYPNPFNPVTTIRFGLPEPKKIRITVINLLGQEITELVNGWRDIGRHEVQWQGQDNHGRPVATGMYFSVLSDGHKTIVQKMLLLK